MTTSATRLTNSDATTLSKGRYYSNMGIRYATKMLAGVVHNFKSKAVWGTRKVPHPALCPDDTNLWRVRTLDVQFSAEMLLDVWEQFSYGYIVTREAEEMGSEADWLSFIFPPALTHYKRFKRVDALLPLLLYTLAQYRNSVLEVGDNTVVVEIEGRRIGVDAGVLLCQHTQGHLCNVDVSVLRHPVKGFTRITDPMVLSLYNAIDNRDARAGGDHKTFLSYLLYHCRGERPALRHLSKTKELRNYTETKPVVETPLPPIRTVEKVLLDLSLEDIQPPLRKLTRGSITAPTHQSIFGRAKNPTKTVRYNMLFRYMQYYNGVTQKC